MAQPLISIGLGLVCEPTHLIVTPSEIRGAWLACPSANAVIVQLDQIRQVRTGPPTRRQPSLAAAINAIQKAHLEHALLRLVRHFGNAQRERVKIQKQPTVMDNSATWHMGITEDEVP